MTYRINYMKSFYRLYKYVLDIMLNEHLTKIHIQYIAIYPEVSRILGKGFVRKSGGRKVKTSKCHQLNSM